MNVTAQWLQTAWKERLDAEHWKKATSKWVSGDTPGGRNCCACLIDETLKIPSNWVKGHIGCLSAWNLMRSRHRARESSSESQRAGGGGSGRTITLKVTECPSSVKPSAPNLAERKSLQWKLPMTDCSSSVYPSIQILFSSSECHSAVQKISASLL